MLRKKLLPGFAFVKLALPFIYNTFHLSDFSYEDSDIILFLKGQGFKLSSTILNFLLECFHLLRESGPKLVQDFLVDLIVLVVHFALNCSVADFKTTKAFEVFGRVEGFATLSDLI